MVSYHGENYSNSLLRIIDIITMVWEFRHYKDLFIIFATKMLRTFAFGMLVLTLIDLLYYKGVNTVQIGVIFALSVCGNAIFRLLITQSPRVKTLILGSLLMVMAGLIFTQFKNFFILAFASIVGVISVAGNQTGPFKAIEQQGLSQLISQVDGTPQKRKKMTSIVQTLHTLAGYACQAAGIYYAGNYILSTQEDCHNNQQSFYDLMATYAMLATAMFILYCFLGNFAKEEQEPSEAQPLSSVSSSRKKMVAAYVLMGIESFGGAFVIYPFLDYFYEIRYYPFLSESEIIGFLLRCCIVGAIGYLLSQKLFNCLGAMLSICLQIVSSILLIIIFSIDHASISMHLFYAFFFLAQLDSPVRKHIISRLIPSAHALSSKNVAHLARSVGLILGLLANSGIMTQMPVRFIVSLPFLIAGCARILSEVASGALLVLKSKGEGALELGSTEMSEHIEKS